MAVGSLRVRSQRLRERDKSNRSQSLQPNLRSDSITTSGVAKSSVYSREEIIQAVNTRRW